jgi:predicted helicase
MSFLLEELGYELHKDDRFKLYLTNTLELEDLAQSSLPGMSSLSEESYSAGKVKKEQPILVVLGNPPYSGHSANKGKWISKEIREYYKVDGKDLGEKNPKWLQDDYVKFIRFAQWKIDSAGEGVLGFITNHSYLDNPTFRGMRQSLMNSFDHIHILDLHGNSKKKEKCPDGSKDRNVFDIQQGVAIIIAVKKPGLEKKISHADLWGLREEKSIWLKTNNINSTKWKTLSPKSPFYFFVPRDEKRLSKYEQFSKITDIFPVNSVGIVTSRDRFTIDADKEELKRRINMFRDDNLSGDIIKKAFNLKDKARWKVKDARSKIRAEENWEEFILPILYRPFDKQWIFYHDTVIERTRKKVMSNMTKENLSLLCCRQQNKVGFRHAFISDNIVESCIVSDRTREIGYTFPIYTYPTEDLYNGGEKYQRDVNIDKALLDKLAKTYGRKSSPEKILCYIYAVLYCNVYRNRYAEFLKSDFPRIPFTADPGLFSKMARYGGNLIELHLLKSKKLEKSAIKFHGRGDRRVEKIEYNEKKKLVKINPEQYFGPLSAEIWQYQIGGYQVMEKWLKYRKGKCLDLEDIKHYCRMATALKETMATQKKIDATYNEIEQHIITE